MNLVLVSLVDINIKRLFMAITNKTDLYYLNAEELIDYSLLDKDKMADVCGSEYMEKQEEKVVRSINQYENTIISMNYETLSRNLKSINKNKNSIIYLKISKEQLRDKFNQLEEEVSKQKTRHTKKSIMLSNLSRALLVFEEREKFIKKNCDFVVDYDISNIDKTANLIIGLINKR